MKCRYKTTSGQVEFELEGATAKELFRELASVQEVFDAEHQCGMCSSKDLRFLARKVDDFDFYELACSKCRARFSFGQAKKGGALFPKRRDEDGNVLEHGGWSRWEPQGANTGSNGPQRTPDPPAPRQPEQRRNTQPPPAGLQKSFDRLGDIFNKPAPTQLGPAIDLIRDQLSGVSSTGVAKLDSLYREFEAQHRGTTDVKIINTLLASMMEVYGDSVRPI